MTAQRQPAPVRARSVGRPRLEARTTERSPREEIVHVAARLFAEVGYANTTMSDIARAAGLQQSSLYYWFKRKEMILQATLTVNRQPVEFLERILGEDGSPGLKLYRLLRYDTFQLCTSPFDVNEVERLAEQQPEVFSGYWEDNQRLYEGVCRFVSEGTASGELIECDAELVSLALLSTQEGMQKRFRYQSRHVTTDQSAFAYEAYAPELMASTVADMALRSLVRRASTLARIQQQAAACADF